MNQLSSSQSTSLDDDVLIKVENVGKLFCRDLKKSLMYGARDMLGDFIPTIGRKYDSTGAPVLRKGEFWANKGVSFELRRGECLGLIGHNGAGKTTLLKMLNGLIKPDFGRITIRGRVGALIALGAGFSPILTGRENVYVAGAVLGLSKKEIDEKYESIVEFAEIEEFMESPVQSYSSGMQVRLGFAVATAMNPDVLLLDEVLAVGDATFRSKCFQRIGSIIEKCAVVFVSHDASSVRRICHEILLLERGEKLFLGDTEKGMDMYSDSAPGTKKLESSMVLGDYISNVDCEFSVTERNVKRNDTATDIRISINFESSREIGIGIAMANIVTTGEEVIGQSMFEDCIEKIKVGRNEWKFEIKDIHLARGAYSLVLGVFEEGNAKLALNLRHNIKFFVEGSTRYGPIYAPISYQL